MKRKTRLFCYGISILLLVMTSCSTTTLTSVWKSDSYNKQIKKVFVVGIVKKQINRKIFEDEFVKLLKAHGVNAMPSYKVLPSSEMLSKKRAIAKIREYNIDTVLVTAVVDRKRNLIRDTWYEYYSDGYGEYGVARTETYVEELYYLETKIYDMGTEELIWSALSETFLINAVAPDYNKEIKSFINVMVKKIQEDNLLK